MNEEVRAQNGIKYDMLSPTERDFIDILPEQYKEQGFAAYKDYKKLGNFTSIFERAKMCTAFMNGIVTAVFMVRKIDEPEGSPEAPPPAPGVQ